MKCKLILVMLFCVVDKIKGKYMYEYWLIDFFFRRLRNLNF